MYQRIMTWATILAGLSVGFSGYAEDQGRIAYATDDALLLGDQDEDWSFAGINTPILSGDRIWADSSGAIELEFPGGYYVRLADGAELEAIDLPPSGYLRAWVGSFYVQRLNDSRGDLQFETAVATFDFDRDTVARIDVLTDGSTTLTVREGRVGVNTDDGRVLDVGPDRRSYIDPGLLPSVPERVSRGDNDTFDDWNALRAERVARRTPHDAFRESDRVPVGVRDLDDYGTWIYVDNVHYWRPTYVHGYVPYRQGRWSHVRGQGYVWVGHQPFSYVTSHYGYWHHHHRHGWMWRYHHTYSPARVVAVRRGDIFLWAPANYYGHPVYGSHFDFSLGGFHFSLAFSSYAHVDHVVHHHHHHHYVHALHHRHVRRYASTRDTYLWRHHTRDNLDYWRNIERNTSLRARDIEPGRRVRGQTQHERRGEARLVASNLERERSRARFRSDEHEVRTRRQTDSSEPRRLARARDVSIDERQRERGTAAETERGTQRTERTPRSEARIDSTDTRQIRTVGARPRASDTRQIESTRRTGSLSETTRGTDRERTTQRTTREPIATDRGTRGTVDERRSERPRSTARIETPRRDTTDRVSTGRTTRESTRGVREVPAYPRSTAGTRGVRDDSIRHVQRFPSTTTRSTTRSTERAVGSSRVGVPRTGSVRPGGVSPRGGSHDTRGGVSGTSRGSTRGTTRTHSTAPRGVVSSTPQRATGATRDGSRGR